MAEFILLPAIVVGIILGLVEAMFVHSDEGAMGVTWIPHALHAIPFVILFVFISMNVDFALHLIGMTTEGHSWLELGVRIAIALVAMIKIAGSAAIAKGARGVGEKIPHTLILGALIFGAPYGWDMFLADIIGPYLPF